VTAIECSSGANADLKAICIIVIVVFIIIIINFVVFITHALSVGRAFSCVCLYVCRSAGIDPEVKRSKSHGYENRHSHTVASDACCYGRVLLLLPAWVCMSIPLTVFSSYYSVGQTVSQFCYNRCHSSEGN